MIKKSYKKSQQGIKGLGTQTVFNNLHEAPFNSNKLTKFYGIIEVGGKLIPYNYDGKYRTEARIYFEEIARMIGGKLDTFSVYK